MSSAIRSIRFLPASDNKDRQRYSAGEVFYDRQYNTLRIYNGQVPGGFKLATEDYVRNNQNLQDIDSDITPGQANTYSLGSPEKPWKSLYVSTNTIYIGGTAIGVVDGQLTVGDGGAPVNLATEDYVNGQGFITSAALYWNNISNKPAFSAVATSGSYSDLTGKPTLFSGAYADLTGKPTLFSGSYTDLTNKPAIPTKTSELSNDSGFITAAEQTAQIQVDWNQSNISAVDYIKNKPAIPTKTSELSNDSGFITAAEQTAQIQVDWNQSNISAVDYIKNKPTIPTKTSELSNDSGFITAAQQTSQVQVDWNQTNTSAVDYIKNKPTIPSIAGLATETYVNTAVSNLVDTAPTTLNTLNELAAALGDDPNFATTVATSIGEKAPLNSPTFTGTVSGITKSMVGLGNVLNVAQEPAITAGTTSQYWRGDKSWQPLDKTAVGLSNVLNVAQEPAITAGTTSQYWRGDKTWQTLNATAVGLGNVTDESKTTMFTSPTFTGTVVQDAGLLDGYVNTISGSSTSAIGSSISNTSGTNSSFAISTVQSHGASVSLISGRPAATETINSIETSAAPLYIRTIGNHTYIASGYNSSDNIVKFASDKTTTFYGSVSGITQSMVGLGNVTNESKATMFTSPTFTGTATIPTVLFAANGFTITQSGSKIVFSYNGTAVFSIDSSGNVIAKADVTGFGAP